MSISESADRLIGDGRKFKQKEKSYAIPSTHDPRGVSAEKRQEDGSAFYAGCGDDGEDGQVQRGAEESRRAAFAGRAAAADDRRALGVFRRQGQHYGRPVCRSQGSGRRLLDAASQVEAAGRRLDE